MQQKYDPHAYQPVLHAGPAPCDARLVTILLHGRGAGAEDILELSREFSDNRCDLSRPSSIRTDLVSVFVSCSNRAKRARYQLGVSRDRRTPAATASAERPIRQGRADGFFSGCMPDAGVCGATPAPVRSSCSLQRRSDRASRHTAQLLRWVRRNAGFHRLQRHRSTRSPRSCTGINGSIPSNGCNGRRTHLSSDGPHSEPRRA